MTKTTKAIGTKWEFAGRHWSIAHADGQVVEIVSDDARPYDYVVRYEVDEMIDTDAGLVPSKRTIMLTALDRELKPVRTRRG